MAVKKYISAGRHVGWRVTYENKTIGGKFGLFEKAEADALSKKAVADGKRRKRLNKGLQKSGITFGDILEDHLQGFMDGKSNYYLSPMKNFARYGEAILNIEVAKLTDLDIDRLLHLVAESTPKKRKHFKAEVDLINAALSSYGGKLGVSYVPKMANQTRQKFKRGYTGELEKSLSPDELGIVLETFRKSHSLPEFFLLVTEFLFGDRIGEAFAYEQTNLKLEAGYIQKTGNFNVASRDFEKSRRLKETGRGKVITLNTSPKVFIEHVMLTAFFNDVLNYARGYSDRWLYPRIGREDKPISYSTYGRHLSKTGLFREEGMLTHKIRKTTKTLGEIEMQKPAVNPTATLLRHSTESVQKRYRDKNLMARFDDIPARLFMKYVLPVYRPTDESIQLAADMRSSIGRQVN